MSVYISFALEIIGTIAFSVSGAMTGIRKGMDLLGISILGLTTAVGGGVVRDLILGITPPKTFQNPIYAVVAIVTALIVCTPWVRGLFAKRQNLYDVVMLWMDSVGLGIFTVVGIQTAHSVSDNFSLFLMIFVGAVTGVGGGLLRDVMAQDPPYIFVKHFYASASLIGAVACSLVWKPLGESIAVITGVTVVLVLRLLAARFRWSLPKPSETVGAQPAE